MRIKICAGNWKMYKTHEEARAFLHEWNEKILPLPPLRCRFVIFPPAYDLSVFSSVAADASIEFGAQNIHFAKEGAFTGELSPVAVKSLGAKWALIGHSERRTLFGETDSLIAKKVLAAFENNLSPMLCVGETLAEREADQTQAVIVRQLVGGLARIQDKNILSKLVIAYEPVWAIGTGRVATPAQVAETHLFIRQYLADKFGSSLSHSMAILYGGSVKPDNARELSAQENVDGFLVGGASLNPSDFRKIAETL